jgi:uncharacterized protein YcfJ
MDERTVSVSLLTGDEPMRRIQLGLCVATILGFASNVEAQTPNYQTRNGAILGGVTGGVIGGIVGHQRGDTAEGALIGGAVGAIAGGVIGNNRDNADRQRYQQYQAQQYHYHRSRPVVVHSPTVVEQRTYVPVQTKVTTAKRPVSVSEVISMSQSGVSDSVIVSHIQANGILGTPDVNEVIWMSEKGVSDYVITYMQQNGKVSPAPIVQSTNREVIIREEVRPTTTVIETVPTYRTSTPVYVERRGF